MFVGRLLPKTRKRLNMTERQLVKLYGYTGAFSILKKNNTSSKYFNLCL